MPRLAQITTSLADVRARVAAAAAAAAPTHPPTLVAVSKYKPASDVAAAYDAAQRDFGENYVHELLEKAPQLPPDIRWHFIGHLQSNKAKALAAIPNLHTLHTLTTTKLATALDAARPAASAAPLNVCLQVNTSGELAKSGLPPLSPDHPDHDGLIPLARHILTSCPHLRLAGLMTIGSLQSSSAGDQNQDFHTLVRTRDALEAYLCQHWPPSQWGHEGRLVLSMGMSTDFEPAIRAGSGIVRVGTAIFGERQPKS
ncbi:hypothetical protein JB92DRAFT_2710576 [Gautieria morchelliformis]|nr:hypothetical protein JB92DRAFT_2710576 [Gautieria morchelliformis]